jgi:tetratricopeptide (TPR) repeat protein
MRLFLHLLIVSVTILSAAAQNPAGVDPLEPARREFQQGNLDAAHAALAKVSEDATLAAKLQDLRGMIFLEQKKFDEALAAFKAAHEVDRNLFLPHIHIGDTYLRQGKWAEAREAYQEVMKLSNVLMVHERLRYGVLLTYLGAKDDAGAKEALERVVFPTETPAYYYAQAAWAFAHGSKRPAEKWVRTAGEIFADKDIAWFARPLHELGWLKKKPPLIPEVI